MVTFKEMMQALEELKMKEQVWHAVKEHLESFLPEGSLAKNLTIDGVEIPTSVVIDVMCDIDATCLGPLKEKILRIEGAKVDESERSRKPSEAKPNATKKRVGRPKGRVSSADKKDAGTGNGRAGNPG